MPEKRIAELPEPTNDIWPTERWKSVNSVVLSNHKMRRMAILFASRVGHTGGVGEVWGMIHWAYIDDQQWVDDHRLKYDPESASQTLEEYLVGNYRADLAYVDGLSKR